MTSVEGFSCKTFRVDMVKTITFTLNIGTLQLLTILVLIKNVYKQYGPHHIPYKLLTLVLLNPDIPCFPNSVDPDQLASEEANWSVSALFVMQYVNLYPQFGLSNLIG